jgi:hypothetical protein
MAVLSTLAPTPSSFSTRAHLLALRRSVGVAVVGFAVWVAVLCSSSFRTNAPPKTSQIHEPEWTWSRSIDVKTPGDLQVQRPTSCYVY